MLKKMRARLLARLASALVPLILSELEAMRDPRFGRAYQEARLRELMTREPRFSPRILETARRMSEERAAPRA